MVVVEAVEKSRLGVDRIHVTIPNKLINSAFIQIRWAKVQIYVWLASLHVHEKVKAYGHKKYGSD